VSEIISLKSRMKGLLKGNLNLGQLVNQGVCVKFNARNHFSALIVGAEAVEHQMPEHHNAAH